MTLRVRPRPSIPQRLTDVGWQLRTPLAAVCLGLLAIGVFAALVLMPRGGDVVAAHLQSPVPVAAPLSQSAPASVSGQVVVFETETTAMTVFDDPRACNNAPELAHTIMNFTDQDITLFADDRCGVELIDVRPGFGSHVAPGQSFAAID